MVLQELVLWTGKLGFLNESGGDDISMVSASHTNEEEDACIAGEGQQDVDDEEIDLETILKPYQ
ncbi:hypothetical protein H5410_041714 [Solanum commersonii]|uniref:Uncharacterized protein n=1 Tax=Solanum commersonii TaxID=4109 RepID=A0A9J5XVI3_SOLCO|nr:hypothetical protein H5410_041714 [Solanum commersonii]